MKIDTFLTLIEDHNCAKLENFGTVCNFVRLAELELVLFHALCVNAKDEIVKTSVHSQIHPRTAVLCGTTI